MDWPLIAGHPRPTVFLSIFGFCLLVLLLALLFLWRNDQDTGEREEETFFLRARTQMLQIDTYIIFLRTWSRKPAWIVIIYIIRGKVGNDTSMGGGGREKVPIPSAPMV